jgi:ABC-2 type transport system permease protein
MRRFAYARYELLRTFRDRRFVLFTFGFPIVLYLLIAGPNRGEQNLAGTGISLPLYYMVGLAAFGAMISMIGSGGRIASERSTGWTRQLRTTPLKPAAYFTAKVMTAYATALLGVLLLYGAGAVLGVRLAAADWLAMTGLIVIALLPFAALGILVGHLVTVESVGALTGGLTSVLALLSGNWFPLGDDGILHDAAQFLPSYWLVQASRVGLGGWEPIGWVVVIAWTVMLTTLAYLVYRRDTQRV